MRPDLEAQFRAKTITVADAAALVRPGQNVYIGCCTSYARAVADAIAARSEDLAEVTIGCSNIIPTPFASAPILWAMRSAGP